MSSADPGPDPSPVSQASPARGHRLALLVSGASGMTLPRHALKVLTAHPAVEKIHLAASRGAAQVLSHELGRDTGGAVGLLDAAELPDEHRAKVVVHRDNELDAPIASGSYTLRGAVLLPCSAGTLGALASGSARTLVHRAGAVALKEGWPLVLGFRETPLSIMHIENMRRVAWAGATLLPPIPAFYIGGEASGTAAEDDDRDDMQRFLDHYLLRVLDRLGIPEVAGSELRWG